MTRKFFTRTGVFFSALIFISSLSFSQDLNFDFIKSAIPDATKYLSAYMTPWTDAFGAGLNGGWYNTAKPHKPLGFDLTMSFNVGIVPKSAGEFDLSSLGLTTLTGSGRTPSVSGPKEGGASLTYQAGGHTLASYTAPGGLNWRYIPVPTIQAGIGLPMGTELKVRYVPNLRYDETRVSLWGIGLMHNITQYIPGDKLLPFDVSVFGGYTKLSGNQGISIEPGTPQSYSPVVSFDNQNLDIEVASMNVSAIASLNLPVITLYGGLGYAKNKTTLQLTGNFPTPVWDVADGRAEFNNSGVRTGSEFGNIKIENFSGLRANIGFRIKLAVITIHADYTRAQYNVISTGLGISFR